ncbi:MAG: AI-2E family transporter [Bacilli bacterium]|nr:AI-2E family transporter [Bacilli bacterium]
MKRNYINILILLLIFLVSIYIIRMLKLTGICYIFISILSPLFFGYVLSWILKPIVDKIKCNRAITTLVIYLLFLFLIFIILFNLVPLMVKEIKKIIPIIKYYILHNEFLYKIYINLNIKNIITDNLEYMNNSINNIFGIFMNIVYSFIFGFYFLISKRNKTYFGFVPSKLRSNINKDLRGYLKSILLDTLFMFSILSIVFCIIGLDSPLIFALFCAITNIIPYIGPYIGGIPAILIGLSNSIRLGVIVLITIIIVQTIENNIIQPLIVSKSVDLNPILILMGLIVFSHFFGIIGMIISTPILLIIRNLFNYYKKNKPKWFNLILDKL